MPEPAIGQGDQDDPIAQAGKQGVAKGASAPGIAEEAFICGLPIVMNHAVMNEFVIDRNPGRYKGPFNTISNEARLHLQGHCGRHAGQRYAGLDALAGPARRGEAPTAR